MNLWKRIESFGIDYIAGQLENNKAQIVAEINAALPAGEASLPALNGVLEQHVSPFLRPIVDGILGQIENEVETELNGHVVDVPAFIDKLVAELKATAVKLRG